MDQGDSRRPTGDPLDSEGTETHPADGPWQRREKPRLSRENVLCAVSRFVCAAEAAPTGPSGGREGTAVWSCLRMKGGPRRAPRHPAPVSCARRAPRRWAATSQDVKSHRVVFLARPSAGMPDASTPLGKRRADKLFLSSALCHADCLHTQGRRGEPRPPTPQRAVLAETA